LLIAERRSGHAIMFFGGVRTSRTSYWFVATLAVVGIAGCHATSRLRMGDAAAEAFRFRGKPIHPMCLNFSLEAASDRPISLATCGQGTPASLDSRGWWTADFPPGEGRGRISYRVLAAEGDRFLVAKDLWSGGTGQFSSLSWVRVRNGQIADDATVHGGDRCAGGLSHVVVDSLHVRYDASTTPLDILRLAGVAVPDSIADQMRFAYGACDGYATYVYDPVTGDSRLVAVTLRADGPTVPSDRSTAIDPETCFEALIRGRVTEPAKALTPAELSALGDAFEKTCIRAR
jgi:hypothetical protein